MADEAGSNPPLADLRRAAVAELNGLLVTGMPGSEAIAAVMTGVFEQVGEDVDRAGAVYEALLTPAARRAGGSHYTPPALADEVVRHTLDPLLATETQPLTVCDPACGGGAFLLAAVRHLARRTACSLAEAAAGVYGVDLDPGAVAVARESLRRLTGVDPGDRLVVGDSLATPLTGLFAGWTQWFPAVFTGGGSAADGGFAAVVGNPPFLGGSSISGTYGSDWREQVLHEWAGGRRGHADLCAYFLLLAERILRPGGLAGLVTTNTIAEGTTRRVGLELLLERGATLLRAARRRPWPGDANLHYSLVWFTRGPWPGPCCLDGQVVEQISARLDAAQPAPARTVRNQGLAFNGSKVYGQGFLLAPAEAEELLALDPRHAALVRPYLSGDDLYGRPDAAPSRWVIDFGERTWEQAGEFPLLLARVAQRVQPERERLRGRNTIGTHRAEFWWQFGSPAPALYRALAGRDGALARVLHSHTHAIVPVRANWVFSHGLAVIVDDDPALLAILQSGYHEAWALAHGSSLGAAPRYTISQTLATFPLPPRTARLRAVGVALEAHRREVMVAEQSGLTRLWQRYHDPSEQAPALRRWRDLQVEVDAATAAAYGWPAPAGHDFVATANGLRFTATDTAAAQLRLTALP